MRTLRWLDLHWCFNQVFTVRRTNAGLRHCSISLPVKVAVKLNRLEDSKHSAVALLGALQVNIDMTCMYHNRGKLINIYVKYIILSLVKTTMASLPL